MIDITQFGKGAVQAPEEVQSKLFRLGATIPQIDWSVPFMIENGFTLEQRDQKSSLSCTGQSTLYYAEALEWLEHQKQELYSARFNYSQSYLPGGGAYIWKAMSIPLLQGAASKASVPDGNSSEAIMIDGSLNSQAIIEAKAAKYAVLPRSNIDQMAQIVKDYGGFVTGFNGRNDMFSPDGTCNVFSGASEWGHAVYVCGFKMHNGKKCLVFKNSWTSQWGDNGYGYFPEDFVNSGLMFDAYVYADIEDIDPMSMNNRLVQVQGQDDVWLVRNGQRSKISNALAFQIISGEWDKIEKISQDQLNALPDSGNELLGWEQK